MNFEDVLTNSLDFSTIPTENTIKKIKPTIQNEKILDFFSGLDKKYLILVIFHFFLVILILLAFILDIIVILK